MRFSDKCKRIYSFVLSSYLLLHDLTKLQTVEVANINNDIAEQVFFLISLFKTCKIWMKDDINCMKHRNFFR